MFCFFLMSPSNTEYRLALELDQMSSNNTFTYSFSECKSCCCHLMPSEFPRITPKIKYLHFNPFLRICFSVSWGALRVFTFLKDLTTGWKQCKWGSLLGRYCNTFSKKMVAWTRIAGEMVKKQFRINRWDGLFGWTILFGHVMLNCLLHSKVEALNRRIRECKMGNIN
jgi:hypothetical protein